MNNTSYRFRLIALSLILLISTAAGAVESAVTVMQRCADKFASAAALDISFSLNSASGPVKGRMLMAGHKFAITSPAMSVWFDGKQQWTYIARNAEVNLTEPTPEELVETNPFDVISGFNTRFKCRKLTSPKGKECIELTAKGKSSVISLARVDIDSRTGWPVRIFVLFDGGNSTEVTISAIKPVAVPAPSAFRFDKSRHPGVEIVDLR